MKHFNPCLWALGALLLLAPLSATAQFIANVDVTDVATVYRNEPGNNGGGYVDFCAGNLAGAQDTRRGFVRYELPATGGGAVTVTRVVVNMTQVRVRSQGDGAPKTATLRLRRVNQAWMEGNGTGGIAACGGGGNVPGVDWDGRPATAMANSATHDLPSTGNHSIVIDTDVGTANDGLLADFQAWMDGDSNDGWELSVVEEGEANNARLITPDAVRVEWTEEDTPAFTINPGLADAWIDPGLEGQGFFFAVYPDTLGGLFFLSWFTFDTERPPMDAQAVFGEAGHRWVTAFGPWDGNVVSLDVELTTGGIFDTFPPAVEQDPDYGTMTIEFQDCDNATLTYDFPSLGLSRTMNITRLLKDNVPLCEALQEQ